MKTLCIIVNYHSSQLTKNAVSSINESVHAGSIRIVVVDNSCDETESNVLREILPKNVILWVSPENVGFGSACNQVFNAYPSDYILLLNPDAILLPGCLLHLQQALMRHDTLGAVGPQIFWDDGLEYLLPPSYPDLFLWIHPLFTSLKSRFLSDCWRLFSIRVWEARRSVRVWNLSGGHVLIRRKAAVDAGGLFDPSFFLYYEDTDLFVRIRQAGYSLRVVPGAKVVHYYDQCDQKNWKNKRLLMTKAYHLYIRKHCKGWKKILYGITQRISIKIDGNQLENHSTCYHETFAVQIPKHLWKGWLFEWSPNYDFIPSIGKFGTGPELLFPEKMWRLLAPGKYYGRFGNSSGIICPYHFITWVIDETEN
jgi:GT2 family glycosyltransferase